MSPTIFSPISGNTWCWAVHSSRSYVVSLHRWEFENLQPVGQTLFNSFCDSSELRTSSLNWGNVVGDFLLGLRLGFAGEHLATFDSPLVKVPDDALQRPSVRRNTLPLVVSRFFGKVDDSSFRVFCSTTNTTLEGLVMSTPMCFAIRRKISPSLVVLPPPLGGEFSSDLFFV